MARIEFGHTWWGKRWLRALSNIDFENRLPRGKRYARNGSVVSITADEHNVAAKVSGRRPKPYNVTLTLWRFEPGESEKLVSLVRNNPYYLSQLEAHTLPPELEQEAADAGIKLFPKNWEELGMRCSCPDWAVPCKHLAAVVYIIANEIDKNPFLVFQMHGLDLPKAVRGASFEEDAEPIVDIESLLAHKPEEYNYYRENLEHIDFATIPDLYPAVSRLLTEFPLFYLKKDFKEILLRAYKRLSREVRRYVKNLKLQEEPPETLFTSCNISIHKGKNRFSGRLKKGKSEIRFDSEQLDPLVEYLHYLSAGDLGAYPPIVAYLIMVHSFALRMMEQHALVPEIMAIRKGVYIQRWIPALFNQETRAVFDALVEALPREVVRYGDTPLEQREQVLFLISFFLRHYLGVFQPLPNAEDDPVTALFFRGAEYTPTRFEERQNANTIHLWLGRFFVRPIHHYPVIHIDEVEPDRFAFEIKVADRRSSDELPVPLRDFLREPESVTLPLLRDLSLLATYLETVNDVLRHQRTVVVEADEFVDRWFAALPALRTLGVRTVVPKVLQDAFAPHLSLRVQSAGATGDKVVSYTSLREMLQFDWSIAAGDTFITPQELFELSGKYRRFVRYKDRYIELDEKHLDSIARRLEKDPTPSPMELLKTGLTATLNGVPVEMDEGAASLFESLLSPPEVDPPENLQVELRPYQLRGYRWLYHNYRIGLGAVVADDMGLGKTAQVIAFLQQLRNEGVVSPRAPALAIVPASLMTNWEREVHKFAPELTPAVYHGSERRMPEGADLVITTYALARRDTAAFKKASWSVSIIDEAQNIKNSAAAQAQAVKSIKAGYSVAMTGTPVENRLLDYWSIIDFVMKGYLGSRNAFKEAYAVPIERYRDRGALARFRTITAPLIMRRLKTDRSIIADLPEKIVTDRFPLLTKEQSVLYQELVEHTDSWLAEADGIDRAGMVFKLMTGLKQICCHPHLYVNRGDRGPSVSGKASMLLDLLETIAAKGEKALVFTQFAEMGGILKEMIEARFDAPCLFLYGGTSRKERDRMIDLFQNSEEHRYMLLSIKAGGVGLNLTAANHVIHYDLWWNPAVENQATDRAFRIGQHKNVTVYRFITRGTFEERINEMIEAKKELADLTVAQGEQWLTKLSTGELKELIRLSGDADGDRDGDSDRDSDRDDDRE